MIASDSELAALLPQLCHFERIAVDTEADSLHCYFEKLCLIQITAGEQDHLVDPLAEVDLQPLCAVLAEKEIVLQGMDFDLRLLRRSLGFKPREVFDTVIAARMLGLREFSLAALVERFFGVTLAKGSQKANWARRPLPAAMREYAKNDTHYLLPLAAAMENEIRARGRMEWFRQSCRRGMEQAALQRERDADEAWRIGNTSVVTGRTGAVLRALWHWRDEEARRGDRPAFHVVQNSALIHAAEQFAAGERPDFVHFSPRRRRAFQAAADAALALPESEWPQRRPRLGTRRTRDFDRRVAELKRLRDNKAEELQLDPAFIAPRGALEAIAGDHSRSKTVLVGWQRELLGIGTHEDGPAAG